MAASVARPGAARSPLATPIAGKVTVQQLQTLSRPQQRIAAMCMLLFHVGVLGVAAARAQTVTPRPGASPGANGDPTRETASQLYDGPNVQRPAGFEPQDRWRMYHLLPMAAAESSAGGRGGSSGATSSDAADLAKKLQNPTKLGETDMDKQRSRCHHANC